GGAGTGQGDGATGAGEVRPADGLPEEPLSRRVRTSTHVARTNRLFRFLEKVRYKWRRRKTLVRFVVLTLDGLWRERITAEAKRTDDSKPTAPGETEGPRRKRPRAA